MDQVWKAFEANEVTHSTVHHLMTISQLYDELGYARVTDVASRLGITRGSASITLKALEKHELIERDTNGFLRLSTRGKFIAQSTRVKKNLMRKFLQEILGVNEEDADVDSCKIEHLIGAESGHQLCAFVHFLTSDSPAAREFMQAFRKFCKSECQVADCNTCEDHCLFAA